LVIEEKPTTDSKVLRGLMGRDVIAVNIYRAGINP
jgi:hypothetical protein